MRFRVKDVVDFLILVQAVHMHSGTGGIEVATAKGIIVRNSVFQLPFKIMGKSRQ